MKRIDTKKLEKLIIKSGYRLDHIAKEIGVGQMTLWRMRTKGSLSTNEILRDHVIKKLGGLLQVDPEVFLIQSEAA